jgi:hypothetical protein
MIEHAVAREALRLGFQHHKFLARPLRGTLREKKDMADLFDFDMRLGTYINQLKVDWLAGTGGLLSHAPRRAQSALILMDGFQPEGVTKLAQDSVFMMPHLGVLSSVYPDIAMEIFEKDCLVRLGTCIAPVGQLQKEKEIIALKAEMPDGTVVEEELTFGTLKIIPLKEYEQARVEIMPAKGFDVGAGQGETLTTNIEGGRLGIIIDARGRPIVLPEDTEEHREKLLEWINALNAYPNEINEIRW